MEMDLKMLAELQQNCQKNGKELNELIAIYDLTELGRDVFQARLDDVINRVLSEHEFYAIRECARCGVAKGDRITDEKNTFLLSEQDFDRLHKLASPIRVAEHLTDEQGYFTERWDDKVFEARDALYGFICKHILPASMGDMFWNQRVNVTMQHKLIELAKQALGRK